MCSLQHSSQGSQRGGSLTLGTGGRAEDPSRDRGDQELARLGAEQVSAQQGTFLGAAPPRDEGGELWTLILTSPKRDVHPAVKSVGGAQRGLGHAWRVWDFRVVGVGHYGHQFLGCWF